MAKLCVSDSQILIVEDNLVVAEILKESLNDFSYQEVSVAIKGDEALKMSLSDFALIFMDICLPDTDGIQLSKIIRKSALTKDIPIICYSSSFEARKRECIEAGMDDFLPKPFSHAQLKEILECWLPGKLIKAI